MRGLIVSSFVLVISACVAACVVKPAGSSSTTPAAGGGGGASGPIEAGCSFNGTQLQGDIGSEFQVSCPANCQSDGGAVWGSDTYTLDSGICKAGIHAGAITTGGGMVSVRIDPGKPAYRGSARNGIQSSDYGTYNKSFTVLNAAAAPPAAAAQGPQVIEAGCSYNATQITGEIGSRHVVACPAGCSGTGSTWGTDVYTADSTICRAAVHAGIITDAAGGNVAVVIEAGKPAYRGSDRNGIKSTDYGQYNRSYRVEKPQ